MDKGAIWSRAMGGRSLRERLVVEFVAELSELAAGDGAETVAGDGDGTDVADLLGKTVDQEADGAIIDFAGFVN